MEVKHHILQTIIKKGIGIMLIVLGLLALLTPLTPGSWLIFIGLEFLGLRMFLWESITKWMSRKKEN